MEKVETIVKPEPAKSLLIKFTAGMITMIIAFVLGGVLMGESVQDMYDREQATFKAASARVDFLASEIIQASKEKEIANNNLKALEALALTKGIDLKRGTKVSISNSELLGPKAEASFK